MIQRLGLIIILISAAIANAFSQDSSINTGSNINIDSSAQRGAQVYITYCLSCHQMNGEGIAETYPPLAKADYMDSLTTDKLINIILNGQNETITVNGATYNMQMPAQNYLSDDQVADVLNYVRHSWSNKTDSINIMPAQVKQQRK